MEEVRELRNELRQLFSTLPCLTCEHPDSECLRCLRWQTVVREFLDRSVTPAKAPLDNGMLLSLPDHLRKTMLALPRQPQTPVLNALSKETITLGLNGSWATAHDVAKITGRARAVESSYLNQLERQGLLKKDRKGRRRYFSIR